MSLFAGFLRTGPARVDGVANCTADRGVRGITWQVARTFARFTPWGSRANHRGFVFEELSGARQTDEFSYSVSFAAPDNNTQLYGVTWDDKQAVWPSQGYSLHVAYSKNTENNTQNHQSPVSEPHILRSCTNFAFFACG